MSQLNLNTTVAAWVAEYPQTSRVFEAMRIDYCCGGNQALEQACWDRELDPQQVIHKLAAAIDDGDSESTPDWQSLPLSELCDNIELTHHRYLRDELPRLSLLIAKVVDAHGDSHPELAEVQQQFATLRAELQPHMLKEELILFPAIRRLEGRGPATRFPFGSIANPIHSMEHEHDLAGEALLTIRRLTHDYAVPDAACGSYRAMLDGLHQLETDMHKHVHKENHLLFPRAIELEVAQVGC